MNNHRNWGTRAVLALLLCASIAPAFAERHGDRGRDAHRRYDTRYSHNRYYPSIGVVVDFVPSGYYEVPYRNDRYYFQGGVWYRAHGPRFVVVTPPIGLAISILPPFYTTVWVGGVPYYYADGVYYAWQPAQRNYIVVQPPRDSEVLALPPEVAQQFVYPKSGQSEQQQAKDKYECHRWAVDQTAYDPTQPNDNTAQPNDNTAQPNDNTAQPNDNTAQPDVTQKRDEYQRATKACLEGRGYSVR